MLVLILSLDCIEYILKQALKAVPLQSRNEILYTKEILYINHSAQTSAKSKPWLLPINGIHSFVQHMCGQLSVCQVWG